MQVVNPIVSHWRQQGLDDPVSFWARAAEKAFWFRTWDEPFVWEPPTFRWFVGGQTNLSYAALDRHVHAGRGGQAALIAETEWGERRTYTYAQLWRLVRRIAAALHGLGIQRGDRIGIYMPTCPEAIALMLAATRIGAIHIVVFAGFGAGALADRLGMAGARAVFTADVTWRRGREVRLKEIVDQALASGLPSVERVVVLRRGASEPPMTAGRDIWWDDFLSLADGQSDSHEVMESNEPAFILATSGTTAKPKLAIHTHGPYQVGITSTGQWCHGLRAGDVWWATSDIGWIVGHSYIVYAPLLLGATTIAFEGALDHPSPETPYRIIEENGITGIFTSPTAVRLLMKYGSEPARKYDLSSVERVVCAGEVLNPPAWEWLQKDVFHDRIPVIDHWWQTETAGPVVGNPYGIAMLPIKPGSASLPLPGMDVAVVRPEDGTPCRPGERGVVIIRRPFPGLTPGLWGEPERYARDYWQRIPGVYFTGDAASVDEDGYFWFAGRADEIIKIADHRIGTIEVESAFLRHPAVAEAGVTGRPDPLRGEVISAFITLKQGYEPSPELERELIETVRRELGPVAVIGEINFVRALPKTRSGKIMRRVLKAVILDRDPGDISTIEEEGSVEEARAAWLQLKEMLRVGVYLDQPQPSGVEGE
ncbi:acetate--CoA ligase [Thermomicrobium sp. 4228-Ro]|uniref:acetate--CoA ligase n=1 Tax=Thermomicrobium sp. 4228-Ro TaxID=2993937 RepID=UPI0022488B61|nr:acetate--CoA ligase [Thermomicrobium sp. 4228-Ro]MCX2727612.1 acetate--CoA ligase [Thermomicrobium sp. 4228-Ro]